MDRGTPGINIVDETQLSSNENIVPSETKENPEINPEINQEINPEINPEENINNITAKGKYDLFKEGLYKNNIRVDDQQKSAGGKTKKYKIKSSRKTIKLRHQ